MSSLPMEFPLNLVHLFGSQGVESLHTIDKNLQIPSSKRRDIECRQQLGCVIDDLGAASAKAQRLPGPITTASKLVYTDQRIYLLVDGVSENGSVVGFIKVGTKKLFLYDNNGVQRECNPLCVLDFYVHESRQRRGYGKRLYHHMIQCEGVKPSHLAVDRPSEKFTSFLSKHYNLKATIPQVNNYVVFEGFFSQSWDSKKNRHNVMKKSCVGQLSASPIAAPRPESNRSANRRTQSAKSQPLSSPKTQARKTSTAEELESLSNIPLARPSSREKLLNMRNGSPVTEAKVQTAENSLEDELELMVVRDQCMAARTTSGYSRYPTLPSGGVTTVASKQSGSSYSHPASIQGAISATGHKYREPIRTREAPPPELYNTHQSVLDRHGRLKVTSTHNEPPQRHTTKHSEKRAPAAALSPQEWTRTFHQGPVPQPSSTWNIFGVPSGYTNIANRRL